MMVDLGSNGQVTQLEVQARDQVPPATPFGRARTCFPITFFSHCPRSVKLFLPGPWQKIQDWTHLSLVLGVSASFLLVLSAVFMTGSGWDPLTLLCLVYIVPCMFYFIRIIGQYDDRLQAKQRDVKDKKEELTKAHEDFISEMDGLLNKSTDTMGGLAERSFDSKRRDFQRFLERAKTKYSEAYSGTKADTEELLVQFRSFVSNWLRVFEECSIDPFHSPKRVVTAEELSRCKDVAEICDVVIVRLRCTEVRFITIQREQDKQMLSKSRNEMRRITASSNRTLPALQDAESQVQGLDGGNNARTLTAGLAPGARNRRSGGVSWISFGKYGFTCCASSQTIDGFPRECSCGCCQLIVLSREHAMLLFGFVVGWLVLLLQINSEVPGRGGGAFFIIDMLLVQSCVVAVLLRFEDLDVIQRLQKEVKALKRVEQSVQQQREKMHDFWIGAQQLTELWNHRTVPLLDLYKEVHSLLEADPESNTERFSDVNKRLEAIQSKLPPLKDWHGEGEGALKTEGKKSFSKLVRQVCQQQQQRDLDQLNKSLDDLTANGMKCLEAKVSEGTMISVGSDGSQNLGIKTMSDNSIKC